MGTYAKGDLVKYVRPGGSSPELTGTIVYVVDDGLWVTFMQDDPKHAGEIKVPWSDVIAKCS